MTEKFKCKECGHEIKVNLIKIPELKIELKYEKWSESYEDLLHNIPKGFRLMKCSEFFKIAELDLLDKITKEKSIDIYLEQLPIDVKNKYSRVLYRNGDLGLSARGRDLTVSDGDGRVIFVRELKK